MGKFIFRITKGYRFLIVVAILLTLAQVIMDLLLSLPIKFILDKSINNIDPNIGVFSNIIKYISNNDNYSLTTIIIFSCLSMIFLSLCSGLLNSIQIYLASYIGNNLTANLRKNTFNHLQNLPIYWHDTHKQGDLVQRVIGNISDIQKFIIDGLVELFSGIITIFGIFIIMFSMNWKFAIISLVIFPFLFFTIQIYTKKIKKSTKRVVHSAAKVTEVAAEDIRSIIEIKAFQLEQREIARFTTYVDQNKQDGIQTGYLQAQFTPLVSFIIAIGTVAIVGVGAYVATGHTFVFGPISIAAGTLTIGTLTVFLNYLKQLYQPIRNLSKLMTLATSAASGAERIQEILQYDAEHTAVTPVMNATTRFNGTIAYHNVLFGYQKAYPILKNISFSIPAGKKIALIGLSGSGKTTLVKLLPHFYTPWDGTITIDGWDIKTLPLNLVRANISIVLQDSVLFEGTIRDNIALGSPHACESDIMEAARKAHIHTTITEMPNGYDSFVREGGKNLSNGQRQRISIARAILRNAPILILDEPTASLDVEAETQVMNALDSLMEGKTVLMISHRLSTLGNVDMILVLHNGVVIEQGSLQELKQRDGLFAKLFHEQNRYILETSQPQTMQRIPQYES